MAASITVHLQIFKSLQLLSFSTDLDETGIKICGLLKSVISNIVIIRVAVPFNVHVIQHWSMFVRLMQKNASLCGLFCHRLPSTLPR